jgi:hypothetical protein
MASKMHVASVQCRYCDKVFYGKSEKDVGYAKRAASNKRTQHAGECPKRFDRNG